MGRSMPNITYKDRKTNIWVRERTKCRYNQQCDKNEMVPSRSYQPPQRRQMDLECHHLETIWKERWQGRPAKRWRDDLDKYGSDTIWQRTAHDRLTWRRHAEAFTQEQDTTAAQWWWCLFAPARLSGMWRCRSIYICLSDRLKSEVALCGELLELSMIHDTWKPAHGIPASGTCICHVSSGKENWNNICVHTGIGPTALSSHHRRKFVAFVSKSGNITSAFQFASVQTEFSQ